MQQTWRIYAPEGRDISSHVKMNLRTMSKYAHMLGTGERFVNPIIKADYGDDTYKMDVKGEEVSVVARERQQKTRTSGVFDNLEKGIFFQVSDENFRDAESKLVKAFG